MITITTLILVHLLIHGHNSKLHRCANDTSGQDSCRYQKHFFHTMIFTTSLFESWPFRGTLENYNQSNNFVLSRFTARPPPLDLRGLSTITECPTHLPLSRAMTESRWEKVAIQSALQKKGIKKKYEKMFTNINDDLCQHQKTLITFLDLDIVLWSFLH